MTKMTKEQYDAQFNAEKTGPPNARAGTFVAKRAFDWQEKAEVYAWDAATLQEETGIVVTNTFEMEYATKQNPLPVRIAFTRPPDCAENEGMYGRYKLTKLQEQLWRIEHIKKQSVSVSDPSPAEPQA